MSKFSYEPALGSVVQRYSTTVGEIKKTLLSVISTITANVGLGLVYLDFDISIIAEVRHDSANEPYPPLLLFLLWHCPCDSQHDNLIFKGYIDCPESIALCAVKLANRDLATVSKWEHSITTRPRTEK